MDLVDNQSVKRPLLYKNGLYLMYHIAKGKRDKRRQQGGTEVCIEEINNERTFERTSGYKCPLCPLNFCLLSSFLLHLYRHSDPFAIQKDIKKEEQAEEKTSSYLRDVGEVNPVKKEEEEGVSIKPEEIKNEENGTFLELIEPEEPQPPLFICHHCNASFSVKNTLKEHLLLHARYFEQHDNKNRCDICLTETSSQESLKEHYFTSHKRSSRLCRICNTNFGSNALRRTHEQFFHEIVGLACVSCRFGYSTIEEVRQHSLDIHSLGTEKTRRCIYCDKEISNGNIEMVKHLVEFHPFSIENHLESLKILLRIQETREIESELTEYQCSYCEKSFSSQKLAKLHETRQHLTSKADDPGYNCQICGAGFDKRANGLRHARRMHGSRIHKGLTRTSPMSKECNYSCDSCDKKFLNIEALINHSRKAHTSQDLIFQCGVCEKRVKTLAILREHIEAVHEKKLIYFCDICGKGHARKSGLRTHMKVNHISHRNFVCLICQQRFAQLNQLNAHQKIHSTKKLYTCQICQKSFAQSSGLNQHIAMHSDTPKYFCSICQISFKYASSFYNHRKSHTTTTEYKCQECNRQCPSRFSLYVHRKTHHDPSSKKFDCSECGKIFKRKDTLKYHILNKHTTHVNYKCEYCDDNSVGFKTKRDKKRHVNEIHLQ